MKIRVIQTVESDDYVFVFALENIGTDDVDRIAKFGEPSIDFGGDFAFDDVEYTLPNVYKKLYSDFPVRRVITTAAPFDTDTEAKLALYRTTLVDRITTAIQDLRAQGDTFTGEYVTNV